MATETPEAVRTTKATRVASDLCEKLADLTEYLDVSSAAYLDPLIRTQIENDAKAFGPGIAAMKAAREAAKKARDSDPAFTTSLDTTEAH